MCTKSDWEPMQSYCYISDFNNELHWFPSRFQYTLAITVLEHGLTIPLDHININMQLILQIMKPEKNENQCILWLS